MSFEDEYDSEEHQNKENKISRKHLLKSTVEDFLSLYSENAIG